MDACYQRGRLRAEADVLRPKNLYPQGGRDQNRKTHQHQKTTSSIRVDAIRELEDCEEQRGKCPGSHFTSWRNRARRMATTQFQSLPLNKKCENGGYGTTRSSRHAFRIILLAPKSAGQPIEGYVRQAAVSPWAYCNSQVYRLERPSSGSDKEGIKGISQETRPGTGRMQLFCQRFPGSSGI